MSDAPPNAAAPPPRAGDREAAGDAAHDPDSGALLPEDEELAALATALTLADGFSLLLCRVSRASHRRRLEGVLDARYPELVPCRIELTPPVPSLLAVLRQVATTQQPASVWLSGLENLLGSPERAHESPLILQLNAARDALPDLLPCPLLIWAQDWVFTALLRGAPDFFSIHSGTYSFAEADEEMSTLLAALHGAKSAPPAELRRLEARLRRLIDRPPYERDSRIEAEAFLALAHAYAAAGRDTWSAAQEALTEVWLRRHDLEMPDLQAQAYLLGGELALGLNKLEPARSHFISAWLDARGAGEHPTPLPDLQKMQLRAFLGQAASLAGQGKLHEAGELFEDAARLAEQIGDASLLAQARAGLTRSGLPLGARDWATTREQPAPPTNLSRMPTRASLRRLLGRLLPTDSDVDAFLLDYFHRLQRRVTARMNRPEKIHFLLDEVAPDRILAILEQNEGYSERLAELKHLLEYEDGEAGKSPPDRRGR